MKFDAQAVRDGKYKSRPTRGAWIEISKIAQPPMLRRSRPTRGAWIEMGSPRSYPWQWKVSRPTRGAWIEIPRQPARSEKAAVAPHTGRVD